jgi:hypothetical protein
MKKAAQDDSALAGAMRNFLCRPGPGGLTFAELAPQYGAYYMLPGLDALGVKPHRSHAKPGLLLHMTCQVRMGAAGLNARTRWRGG